MSQFTQGEFLKKLDEYLKAVYGAGRNSRLKLSDNEVIDPWMSVDQAKSQILSAIRESLPEKWTPEHRMPSNGTISDEKYGYNKGIEAVERQLLKE